MFTSLSARALGLALTACETVELANRVGFQGVDLLVRDLVERGEDLSQIRALMAEHQIKPGAWPLPMNWRNHRTSFEVDLALLPRYARVAEQLGLCSTCTWVEPASFNPSASITKHLERIGAIAQILDDHGVRLGLEVIGVETFREAKGDPLYHRMGAANFAELFAALAEKVPSIGLTVDAFHIYAAAEDHRDWEKFGVERVVWVHVADLPANASGALNKIHDADRGLPGEHGSVDCQGLLGRLAELGYAGPVSAEPMQGCRSLADLSVEEIAGRTVQALAQVWPQRDQTGTASRSLTTTPSERLGAISSL